VHWLSVTLLHGIDQKYTYGIAIKGVLLHFLRDAAQIPQCEDKTPQAVLVFPFAS
jgi:hypothetical protein